MPWRLVCLFILAQFAALWPVVRSRPSLLTVMGCTLAAQAALHTALTLTGGPHDPGAPGHAHHTAIPEGDGHSWHHATVPMTIAHVVAALVAAWLLHHADTAISAALATTRAVRRTAGAVLRRGLPTPLAVAPLPDASLAKSDRFFGPLAVSGPQTLEHALVRRGPPDA
ncbi:hypothetical protein [Streptomyces sp. NBC_00687]|uniref:hypothetical protein n=1 Tax=Streptomyces sp. NBC_00687 TaxID=2975807 RepID=UPI002253119B|nr:hypothetical protein [Streptomyces sp. NBC_00687]MCX4920024.1 hypothetical protein [Streptomyces sp. NBC_00687]